MLGELTDREVVRMVELVEAAGIADWGRAIPPDLAEKMGKSVKKVGGAVATVTLNVDLPLFNRVIGLGIEEPATEEMVDEIVALYKPGGVRFIVHVSPAAQPVEIPAWLEARGLERGDRWAKFYRSVESLPEVDTELRVEEIGEEEGDTFMEVGFKGFGIPEHFALVKPWLSVNIGREGWRHYLAYDGEVPVGLGILFVKGEVGSLLGASTIPEYRNRGAQGALMVRRIRDAAEMGCRWVITETGEETPEKPNPLLPQHGAVGVSTGVFTAKLYIHASGMIDDRR